MLNIKLDNNWDLNLDPATANLAMVSDNEYTQQKIRQRLDILFGEWFGDRQLGIPWYDILLGQIRPDLAAVRARVVATIAATPGVKSVTSVTIDAPSGSETATIQFKAELSLGGTAEGEVQL